MIKVLLVDDEDFAREAIRKKIAWAEMGLEIVGEANSAAQALARIGELEPQILITDVSMPAMDGIALAAEARKRVPALRVVFISGHDRFEYVKSAIRIGVSAYLLKPVDPQELRALLEEIAGDLRMNDILLHQSALFARQLEESKPLLRTQQLFSLLENGAEAIDAEKYRYLQIDLGRPLYTVMQVHIARKPLIGEIPYEKWETVKLLIVKRIEDTMPASYALNAVWSAQNELILILGQVLTESAPLLSELNALANGFLSEIVACSGMKATIAIGQSVKHQSEICVSFHQARQAMAMRTYVGYGHVISWKDLHGDERAWDGAYSDWEADIVSAIRSGVPEKVGARVDAIFEEIVRHAMRLGLIRAIAFNLIATALRVLGEMDDTPSVIAVGHEDGWWGMLEEGHTVPEIQAVICRALGKITERVNQLHNSRADWIAAQVMERIHAAYREKLTLQQIAAELHFTPDWVGALFRKKTGQSFSEYLTGVRMQQAMLLLRETDRPVYEIAEAVGYQNVPYFSSIFKNLTGMSPRTYRNQYGLSATAE